MASKYTYFIVFSIIGVDSSEMTMNGSIVSGTIINSIATIRELESTLAERVKKLKSGNINVVVTNFILLDTEEIAEASSKFEMLVINSKDNN